jgi:8-oxo-dGTP pyrophosphatase MutT (NUDIX family)
VTSPLRDDALAVLDAWEPSDRQQSSLRDEYVAFLAQHPDGHVRECTDGHLTASALIFDPVTDRVLLTLHPKVSRWLQTGGHIEVDDASLHAAAAREAREESGIHDLIISAHPVRLDKHLVPCRPQLLLHHYDVQYLALAPEGSLAIRSSESLDLQWFDADALPADTDDSVRLLVAASRMRLTVPIDNDQKSDT